ncbi:MAG: PAS domain S-box protein, partial [Solirubrobacteraceae bacterium]|nr:PAS domain S-box protein [Solirubrobacteraceae bacterium]
MTEQHVGMAAGARDHSTDLSRFWQLSTDLFAVVDEAGRFVSVNPAWDRVTGWRDELLLGQPITKFVHPEDRAMVEAARDRLDPSGYRVLEFESRWQCADKSYRWLLWSGAIQDGAWYVVAKNVTATRASHAALRRSERHSRALLGALQDGMYVMDADMRIVEVNDRFCELVGLPRSAIEGTQPPFPWWPESIRDEIMDRLKTPAAGGRQGMTRLVRADGRERRVQVDWSEVPIAGQKRPGRLVLMHDLTELLEIQQTLVEAHDAAKMISWAWDAQK